MTRYMRLRKARGFKPESNTGHESNTDHESNTNPESNTDPESIILRAR